MSEFSFAISLANLIVNQLYINYLKIVTKNWSHVQVFKVDRIGLDLTNISTRSWCMLAKNVQDTSLETLWIEISGLVAKYFV